MADSAQESVPPPGWSRTSLPTAPAHGEALSAGAARTLPAGVRARPRRGLVWLLIAALALGTAALAILGPSGGNTDLSLRGAGFSTVYPAGWSLQTTTVGGLSGYLMGSEHSRPDGFGIPPPGHIGMTISVTAAARVAALAGRPLDLADPLALLSESVGTPAGATGQVVRIVPHRTTLDGHPAAEAEIDYLYGGVANQQTDVVSSGGGGIAFLEVDSQPADRARADRVLSAAVAHWRWN
ncbi:MAG TPA: hypothetical protein VFN75_11730 [Pseudonocardiaceae bacterium]|nr:hypothetical protein [Pseudonocardiaceae bacterium]